MSDRLSLTDPQSGKRIQRGLINRDRLTRTLAELIARPSVNPFDASMADGHHGESRVASYLADRLSRLGWGTEFQEYEPGRCNLVARHPAAGERPSQDPNAEADASPADKVHGGQTGPGEEAAQPRSLMLAGHLDTVQVTGYAGAFDPRIRDGRVYGRGACDMKAALACYIEVAEVLHESGYTPRGALLIAGVADEEYRQIGAKVLHESGVRADGIVIGEPTDLEVHAATKGLAAFDLTVNGRATHSSVPQHGSNSIVHMARLVARLDSYEATLERVSHPLLGHPTFNIGVVKGGTQPNVVPAQCTVQMSRRLLPGEDVHTVREAIQSHLDDDDVGLQEQLPSQPSSHDEGTWTLSDAWWHVEPYELDSRSPLLYATTAAAQETTGETPRVTGFPASSDAAYFGDPALLYGPGSLAQAHSNEEWVAIDDLVTATEVYLRLATNFTGPDR